MEIDFSHFQEKRGKIMVIGLGYVGMPLAFHLDRFFQVIGYDISESRVKELKANYDGTGEISFQELQKCTIEFTTAKERIKEAHLIIITTPTPVDEHKIPDLSFLKSSSQTVGTYMERGTIVVYESTVYPGATEEVAIPILEEYSGLKNGLDFKVAYSPERVNVGDKLHDITRVVKVIGGQDPETTRLLKEIYGTIIEAGVHLVSNIKTAEAAKVIENIQRDLNIALANELALIFNRLQIDTREVINAAATKWNFHYYEPGLVGGHCIGVDPYYLTYKAGAIGYNPEVILAGRRINDQMGKYIGEQTVKKLIEVEKPVKGTRVLILGITFKENITDIRNSKIVDIYQELQEFGVMAFIHDPLADAKEVEAAYHLTLLKKIEDEAPYDGIILAVKHQVFLELGVKYLRCLTNDRAVLIDVKAAFHRDEAEGEGFKYWRL